jgi:hypothetical protein
MEYMQLSCDSDYIKRYVTELLSRYARNISCGAGKENQDRSWHLSRERIVRNGFANLEGRLKLTS